MSLESLAHYKILDRIGAGGMGEVYRARDTRLGRTVAIKVLPADVAGDPERRDRFLREARASAALSHPNIAALYEIGEDQGHLFLALEYVPGEPLSTVIGGRPMNPRRAIKLAVQIADALADAHAAGIVHRDIKPANIVVTPRGNAKILDFGLATWTAGGAERDHAAEAVTVMATSTGTTLGTVAYMSPEQALGQHVDQRTDIFSLGIVLFEMLTGRLPFNGATATAIALQIVQAPAPAPTTVNRSLPPEVDAIVGKALAKGLDERYESAATLSAELRSVAAILDVRAERHAAEPAAVPLPTRRGGKSGASWIIVLALLAALAALAWSYQDTIQRVWRRTLGPAPAPVIAVIPLELAGADASQTYFADGLTEDLITRLGQTPGLKVLGRSATRDYRGRPPRQVANDLGAGVVLTGSLRPSGDAIKVSLELIDPADGTAIWSNQYTREIKDVFAVQAQVAEEVAQALRVKLQPTPASARAASRLVDRRAYDLYMHGRHATAERRLADAIATFEHAIAADAGLAEAHAGLAEAIHLDAGFSGTTDDPKRQARLKAAADRAYELDPDLPQANLAAALAADRLADALGFLKKAITLDSTYSEGYHQIGDQILDFDPLRAIQFYRRALALDPRMDVNHVDIVSALLVQGRFDEAQRELDSVTDSPAWKMPLRLALALDRKQYDAALALLRQGALIHDLPLSALNYVAALRMSGARDEAYREATKLASRMTDACEARAMLAGLKQERGETQQARELVAPAVRAAAAPGVLPSTLRCGVLSAAAIGDAPAAAALLRQIAGDERMLRAWAAEIIGTSGSKSLRRGMFPWTHVNDRPEMKEARAQLDEAYRREREVARAALEGLP